MTPEEGFEPARRELCPDGGCIGLIGADGRCKVCGTVSPSAVADPRHQGMVEPRAGQPDDGEPDENDERQLCPDGACLGLIGADGRCNVCGRERAGAAEEAWTTDGGAPGGAIEVEGDEDARELCPDGACLGLIGANGRCKVCGLARGSAPDR